MPAIRKITAREILDSRGTPTVEADVELQGGAWGRGMAPSGASTGRHEALELRDGDPARYGGRGVLRAVANIREIIAPALAGREAVQQAVPAQEAGQHAVDAVLIALDGTPNKGRLGANAILAVSLAVARASAAALNIPFYRYIARICPDHPEPAMPLPMVNILSGGLHTGDDAALDVQDFLVAPIGARTCGQAIEWAAAVHRAMRALLAERGLAITGVADEGGFAPRLASNRAGLEMMVAAFERAGLRPGADAAIALDIASTHLYREGRYAFTLEEAREGASGRRSLDSAEMVEMLAEWRALFPLVSIEDGLAEDDWEGWRALTARLGAGCQLVGDDLFTTHPERLARGIQLGAANAVLVKMNQIGTITETLAVIAQARAAGYRPVVSARSGETEDDSLADLAVGSGAGQIKIGSITRSERLAKYNRLIRIEEELCHPALRALF